MLTSPSMPGSGLGFVFRVWLTIHLFKSCSTVSALEDLVRAQKITPRQMILMSAMLVLLLETLPCGRIPITLALHGI